MDLAEYIDITYEEILVFFCVFGCGGEDIIESVSGLQTCIMPVSRASCCSSCFSCNTETVSCEKITIK